MPDNPMLPQQNMPDVSQPSEVKEEMGNPYYLHKVKVWKKVRLGFLIFFICILLMFVLLNFRTLDFEHFYYFASDFKASVVAKTYDEMNMEYVADEAQSLTLFRNGLCVAGTHNVSIFTAGSRQLISDTVNLSSPIAVASDKNALVYDLGSYEFLVYNSFACILDEKLDEPILTGAVSNRGDIAIVTAGKENVSNIYLYNSGMNLVAKIKRNTYVMQVAFSESGKTLAMTSVDGVDGQYILRVEAFNIGRKIAKDPIYNLEFLNEFPLGLGYTRSNQLVVVSDQSVHFIKEDGKSGLNYRYSQKLVSFSIANEGCALVFDENLVKDIVRLICWDEKGKELVDSSVNADSEQVVLRDGYVWLKGETLTRFSVKSGKAEKAKTEMPGKKLLVGDHQEILLCSPSKAVNYRFDKE